MKNKNLNVEIILNKKFSIELSGYNPKEVDEYLDQIIQDYNIFNEEIDVLKIKINEKNDIIASKEKEIERLTMKVENLKQQLKESSKANNYELLQEIKKLQKSNQK